MSHVAQSQEECPIGNAEKRRIRCTTSYQFPTWQERKRERDRQPRSIPLPISSIPLQLVHSTHPTPTHGSWTRCQPPVA